MPTEPDALETVEAFLSRAVERARENGATGDLLFSHGATVVRASDMLAVIERCRVAERQVADRDDENTLLTGELAEARHLYEAYCTPPEVAELLRERDEACARLESVEGLLGDLGAENVRLRADLKERSEWGQRAWNAWRSARDRAQRYRAAFPTFATPAGPVHVHYMAAAPTAEEAGRAKRAVTETVVEMLREQRASTIEVTTSEPNAALYFMCQNHHPLALRTITAIEDGKRRVVRYEPACPQCEAAGITEVRLLDLNDDGAEAERGETVDPNGFVQHLDEGGSVG